ncbi:MAG: hypothetical protein AVO35_09060 [Candidatus Aegiribacteria sp. MLS_C]|nr:MAG: hypothetical protein AVO35_09060 [Candidatus Aegiribacteria sp. MLS_C]
MEEYIFARRRMGMKFGLDRVRKLMAAAGDPQRSYRTVHIVGTNGKGSTTAYLAGILQEMGYRVGRMTSPHLLHYRERAAVNGEWIPESEVVEFVETFRDSIEQFRATFFEITTVMSAWYFRKAGVEVVSAEAGLGGRLDATRLLDGGITVFTGVEIEHRRILGPTEAAIATEKVAMAKEGSILVAYTQKPEVEEAIASAVAGRNLRRVVPEPSPFAPLPGGYQPLNAGLAVAAAGLLSGRPAEEVLEVFRNSGRSFRWAGRIDLREGEPPVLFDVAHSPGSMAGLIEYLGRERALPVPAVVGFLEDKFWREMTLQMKGVFEPVVATTPLNERSLPAEILVKEFRRHGIEALCQDDIGKAMDTARGMTRDLLVVTGSFFVTGEAMLHAWRCGWIRLPERGEEPHQLFRSGRDVDTPEMTDL